MRKWCGACWLLAAAQALSGQTISGVVNAASLENRLSPGALAYVNGISLAAVTTVTVGGKTAAIVQSSPARLTIQIPFEATTGSTTIQAGDSAPFNITLNAYAPAIFTADGTGMGTLSATHANGGAVDTNNPANPGETISFLATGLGATIPPLATGTPGPASPLADTEQKPTVGYATETATLVSSVMAPGKIGVYQVTIRLTGATVTGNRAIGLSIGGVTSGFNVSIPISAALVRPIITSVASATGIPGSVQENIQAGSWVAIYGTDLSLVKRDWTGEIVDGRLPTVLTGVSVSIDGKPAAVYFISSTQINVQAPDIGAGPVQVVVSNNGQTSSPFIAQARTHAPAFFQWGSTKYAVVTRFPDNASVGGPALGPPWVGVKTGDIVILWGTGFGPTQPAIPPGVTVSGASSTATLPLVTIGGVGATVYGAALSPGLAGVYQIALMVPPGVGTGDAVLKASIGGFSTPDNVYVYLAPN